MNNYKLTIQYDGTRYKGWQRLGNTDNTIQGKIEKVLSEMVGSNIEIAGCSRTDAGVHALYQVANFKTEVEYDILEIKKYLDTYLPEDISVSSVVKVSDKFHSRYNAKDKTYLYKVWNEQHTNPFERKFSMHVEKKLDMEKMEEAIAFFVGEHDFTSFTNVKSKSKSMVREVKEIKIKKENGMIYIRITGDGFLHNMVRKILGTLIEIGKGNMKPEEVKSIIEAKQRNLAGQTAEAKGLFLESVEY